MQRISITITIANSYEKNMGAKPVRLISPPRIQDDTTAIRPLMRALNGGAQPYMVGGLVTLRNIKEVADRRRNARGSPSHTLHRQNPNIDLARVRNQ
jgi:hypothetical protein